MSLPTPSQSVSHKRFHQCVNHKKNLSLRHPLPAFGSFSFFQASLWLEVDKVLQKLTKSYKNEPRHLFQCCILIPRICPHKTPFQHTARGRGEGREGKAGVNRVSYFKSVTCQYPLTHNRQGREEFDSFLTCHPSSQVWNLGRGAFNNYVDQILPNLNHLSTYPTQVENCGHFTRYLLFILVTMPGLSIDHLPTFSCPRSYWMPP